MLSMYTNAVKFGYLKIEEVPDQYRAQVKTALGIVDAPPAAPEEEESGESA